MTELKIIKAWNGDGFILHVEKEGRDFYMVVDGGPLVTKKNLYPELQKLSHMDVVVITHYHSDHNRALVEWLVDNNKINPETTYFVNLPKLIKLPSPGTDLSAKDAKSLSDHILDIEKNKGIKIHCHNKVVMGKNRIFESEFIKIWAIAPSQKNIDDLLKHLDKKDEEKKPDEKYELLAGKQAREEVDTRELKDIPLTDNIMPNIENDFSMALLIETYDNKRILLGGDASVETMCEGLRTLGYSEENPCELDLYKLSHHGSRNNISNELMKLIRCHNYLITTNGKVYHHPDRETVAKLIFHEGRNFKVPILMNFNYCCNEIKSNNPGFDFEGPVKNTEFIFEVRDEITEITL